MPGLMGAMVLAGCKRALAGAVTARCGHPQLRATRGSRGELWWRRQLAQRLAVLTMLGASILGCLAAGFVAWTDRGSLRPPAMATSRSSHLRFLAGATRHNAPTDAASSAVRLLLAGATDGESEGVGEEEMKNLRERLTRQLSSTEPVIGFTEPSALWAKPDAKFDEDGVPQVGSVLLAHPRLYDQVLTEYSSFFDIPAALRRTQPTRMLPPRDAPRRERSRLPVVLLTSRTAARVQGLMLGWWSGLLMGDEPLDWLYFQTRPLYIGGWPGQRGLSVLHAYPELPGSERITRDGLMISRDIESACKWVDTEGSPIRFKFFMDVVEWPAGEEHELRPEAGVWVPTRVSRDLILREPDSSFEDPVWAQIVERAGGEVAALARAYGLLE
mmetsp:Transcript_74900/g.173633  ORF Transcript_74900/g.173633 Transcript_74900/m.173633 type:complete len:386 (+) Transcript_74900:14-1171(+)